MIKNRDNIEKTKIIPISYKEILFLILVSAGLYITSLYGYLLFHGLVEVFSIVVAICIFMIAWNSRYRLENNYLLFIGISLLFSAAIDLLHTLAYKGMGVFSGYDANLPTQLWIAARYLQSISLLIAPLFFYRKLKLNLNVSYLFFIYSIVFSLLIASIFYWKNFPDCFIEGKGLTTFKIVSEYVISLIMAASIYLLYKNRKEFDENVFSLLVASIILLIFSEMAFTAYASVFGFSNMLGHIFKFIAFYLIYKAIIVTGFMKPYDLIFRDLKKTEKELIKHQDHLEELVGERTVALEKSLADRKRAEEALKEQYSTLRSIIDSANAMVFSVDRQYCYTSFNKGHAATMKALYGADIEYGHSLLDYMTVPEDRETARRNLDRALAGEQLVEESYSGEELRSRQYFQVSHGPIKTEEGEIIGVAVLAQDMTERKRVEDAWRKSQSRLQHALEASDEGLWEWHIKTGDAFLGPRFYTILGYKPDEFPGSYEAWISRVHPDDAGRAEHTIADYFAGRSPSYDVEIRMKRKDGQWVWTETHGTVVERDEEGNPLRMVGTLADISERKRAEEELRKYQEHLEELVKKRTTEIDIKREELQENQKALLNLVEDLNGVTTQLEATNKELEAFSYSVSHDLRAPLRAIEGFCQALLEDYTERLDEPGRDYLNRVCGATQKMSQLIDAMLSLSRLTRGVMKREAVDLSALARTIADELQKTQPDRKVEFVIAEGVTANGDATMLRIVLENFLGNAWKFTGKHPSARIEFGVKQVDGKTAYFVRDDGAGFDIAYADKLFTAFQRLHTEAEFPGIGIGLATVQRIIHRHGGRVWAEGEVEKGATFYFTI